MEEEWKEKAIEKIRQALAIERWGEGYNSLKVSIIIDSNKMKSRIEVGKKADE